MGEMYPRVKGEFDTVRALLKGRSIARFGDGELKILDGRGYIREPANGDLTEELREVAAEPNGLIGIPTMDPAGPKFENWQRHESRFLRYFKRRDGRRYYSAFITRPDSAADNIESAEYFDLLSQLWGGKDAVVLSEASSKVLTCVKSMATVVHIECPRHRAYSFIDDFERAIVRIKPSIALLSCGPTATCLAHRLAGQGIQAIDIGSVGGMLARLQG
jgi:hypothetical protein